MSVQFAGDSKPCQQWNGPCVEQNVMTQKTIGIEYGMAPTLLWHVEVRWQAGESACRRQPFKGGRAGGGWGVSSPLSLSPFGNTFSFQLFYLCQLPCRTLRDIGAVEAWVRGPAIHSSLCLSFWAHGIYGPTTGRRPREKEARWLHLRGTSAKPRSNRTAPAQTGPKSPSKLLRPIIKKKKLWNHHYFMTFQICGFSGN